MAINPPAAQWQETLTANTIISVRRWFLSYNAATDTFSLIDTGPTAAYFVLISPGVWQPQANPAPGSTLGRIGISNGILTIY